MDTVQRDTVGDQKEGGLTGELNKKVAVPWMND